MEPLTIRIHKNTKESIDSEAGEYDVSVSEYVRTLIEYGREYYSEEEQIAELKERAEEIEAERDELADRVEQLEADLAAAPELEQVNELNEQLNAREERIDELEAEVETLDARNTDLTNQLAEANSRIDAANELVEYVDDERNAQQRWREAGLIGKAKYTVFGMPTDEESDIET